MHSPPSSSVHRKFLRHHPHATGRLSRGCVAESFHPGAKPPSPQVKSMYIYIHLSHQSCMKIIRAPTIARAHELAVKMVLEKGWALDTEDAEATIEYEGLALDIENPFSEPMASPCSRFQRRFLETYADNLLNGSPAEFEYRLPPPALRLGRAPEYRRGGRTCRSDRLHRPEAEGISREPPCRRRHLEPRRR